MSKVFSDITAFEKEAEGLGYKLPFTNDTSILGDTVSIASKKAPNRLVCQAMEGCDGTSDGCPGNLTRRRYERLAKGGSGMIWYEATAVLPEGRANPRQLYINETNLDIFKRHVEEIKKHALLENGYEPVIIMQATHSGRYSKPNGKPEPIIAYSNPIFEGDKPIDPSRIATDEYLDIVNEALVKGAALAEKAGFDGVDIKCCHRYLNSELLSAFERKGRYGGDFENRTRLLRESVSGARAVCGNDFIISTRLNVYDGFPYPYGFGVKQDGSLEMDLSEPILLIKKLEALGVPLVNITMGNPYVNPHVNRPFALGGYTPDESPLFGVKRMLEGTAELKKHVKNMKLICSGISFLGTAAPHVVSSFIENGSFDFAGFGRMIFAYPDFAKDILKKGRLEKNNICMACSKCTELMRAGSTPGCVIRDSEIYAPLYRNFCKK